MARETERWAREPWRVLAGSLVAAAARHPAFDHLVRRRGGGRVHRLRRGGFVGVYGETYQIFGPVGAARLLAPAVATAAGAGAPPHRDLTRLDELAAGTSIERVTALATRGYLTNQLLRDIDAVSMAHALEVRVPFVDHRLAESIWPSLGHYPDLLHGKHLLQRSVPRRSHEIAAGPKRGFTLPFDSWMRGGLRETALRGVESTVALGWVNARAAATVWSDWERGRAHWSRAWSLSVLGQFLREAA